LAEVAALQSSHEQLSRQAAELNEELNALNTHELEIEDLERQADLLQVNYLTHAEKLEEARVDDALRNERISSLNIVQPATLESKAVSPKRAVTLFSALVLATFLGLLAALVGEYSNPLLQAPEQVEAVLDVPVVATIPRTSRFRAVSHGGVNER
jgi:tyrosine-protein kinase Etk/Wzc